MRQNSGQTINLNNLTIANGKQTVGAGLLNYGATVTVTNSTFKDNQSTSGSAISNQDGIVTITNCTFKDNQAGIGAAITTYNGSMTIKGSLFANNHATGGSAIDINGGAIIIANSTFFDSGSTIIVAGGTVNILNATLESDKEAVIFNAGVLTDPSKSTVTLKNSILVNSNGKIACIGSVTDGGHNLQSPGANCGSTIAVGDAKLGPLADNGGPTLTMALQPGSAALGAASADTCLSAPVDSVDQRGNPRNRTGNNQTLCDIGAYEHDTLIPSATSSPTT